MLNSDFVSITTTPGLFWGEILVDLDDLTTWRIVRITIASREEHAPNLQYIVECECLNFDDECLFFSREFGSRVVLLRDHLLVDTAFAVVAHLDSLNLKF